MLHFDLEARIGVVVDWRELKIVTVMHLNSFTFKQLCSGDVALIGIPAGGQHG